MKIKILTFFVGIAALFGHAQAAELVTLNTRPDVEQKFILIKPKSPVASVILFAGGMGALNLSSFAGEPIMSWGEGNFLVRTRNTFAEHGLMVAVVDAPSDHQTKRGMLFGFRTSEDHATDIDHVIRYLRSQADVPVWLVGTSRGTESAASVAIRSSQHPDGVILTSPMSVSNKGGAPVTSMDLEKISVPTLVVAHAEDQCDYTPPSGADQIAGMLKNASKVAVKKFEGGARPRSKPCQAASYHGFLGIEDKVVEAVAQFIKAN